MAKIIIKEIIIPPAEDRVVLGAFFLFSPPCSVEYESPVPGIPAVAFEPFVLMFKVAPFPPTDKLVGPFFPIFNRTPGKSFLLLRNLMIPI